MLFTTKNVALYLLAMIERMQLTLSKKKTVPSNNNEFVFKLIYEPFSHL